MEDMININHKTTSNISLKRVKWTKLSSFGNFKKKIPYDEDLSQLKNEILHEIEIDRKIHSNNVKKYLNKYTKIMEIID